MRGKPLSFSQMAISDGSAKAKKAMGFSEEERQSTGNRSTEKQPMPAIRVCPSGLRTSCRPIPFASRLLGSKPFPPVYTPRGEESPRGFAANSRSHQAASAPATRIPVRDCVSSSAANNTSERAQPSRKCRRHPRQNGSSAHIAAAAWLGFAKPKA